MKAGPKRTGVRVKLLHEAENVKAGLQWRPQMVEML